MTLPILPSYPGQSYPVSKMPTLATRRALAQSGRSVSSPMYDQVLWNFEMGFEVLSDSAVASAVGALTLQSVIGFYVNVLSIASQFYYRDPDDNIATLQQLGTGDGATTFFYFTHSFGITEPVGAVEPSGLAVYINGTLTTAYTLTGLNGLTFTTAPASGAIITASYTYYFVCEFMDDSIETQKDMQGLWSLKSLKFRSVRP